MNRGAFSRSDRLGSRSHTETPGGELGQPVCGPAGRSWPLWVGLGLAVLSVADASWLAFRMSRTYVRLARGTCDVAPRSMWTFIMSWAHPSMGGIVLGGLGIAFALLGLGRADQRYARLAVIEIALCGLSFLTILLVCWGIWGPSAFCLSPPR